MIIEDWWIRTEASYMATDWRYGSGIEYKIKRRQSYFNDTLNYYFNFNHTNGYYQDFEPYDLNEASHGEERLYFFGAPYAMPDKFTDEERNLSQKMMQAWGNFIKYQK